MRALVTAWFAAFALAASGAAAAPPTVVHSGAETRRELHVTAYRGSQPMAFIREVRELQLPAGDLSLALADVPDTVRRQTVGMRVLEGGALEVLEQTYGFHLLSPGSLMRASEGGTVTLDHPNAHTGDLQAIGARVVSSVDGTVLQTSEGFTYGIHAERTRLSQAPAHLTPRPTLRWLARSAAAGNRRIELTYLVDGMSWSADYVATVSRDGSQADLAAWVTFQNNTVVRLDNVRLGLMAGQVHQVIDGLEESEGKQDYFAARTRTLELEKAPVRESLSDLHLYKVPTPTDLEPRSIKNIQLLSLHAIPIKRRWSAGFWIYAERSGAVMAESPELELELINDRRSHAGVPLPAGTVRVMVPDQRGNGQLVGQSWIKDTPEDEKLTIRAGRVGDVKFVIKQTEHQSAWFGAKKATFVMELRNRSRHAGQARVDLHVGGDVQLEVQGAQVSRPSAATWRIETPLRAGEVRKIQLTARQEPRQR